MSRDCTHTHSRESSQFASRTSREFTQLVNECDDSLEGSATTRLVNTVANAHYDTIRYPGHIALFTCQDHRRRVFLQHAYAKTEGSWYKWLVMYFVASGTVATITMLAFVTQKPPMCTVLNTLSKLGNHSSELDAGAKYGDLEWPCRLENNKVLITLLSTFPVVLAPVANFILTLVLSLSRCCTDRLVESYYRWMLWATFQLRPYLVPVLFNYTEKPEKARIGSPWLIWRRQMFLPYQLIWWFSTMLALFMVSAVVNHDITVGGLLILFVCRVFFPTMAFILGAPATRQEIIMTGLKGVWLRLFETRSTTFSCTSDDINEILYFAERCHHGIHVSNTTCKAWPIQWHDELLLTGNNVIREIYLDDYNVLITKDGHTVEMGANFRPRTSSWDETIGSIEINNFLTRCADRIANLYNCPDNPDLSIPSESRHDAF